MQIGMSIASLFACLFACLYVYTNGPETGGEVRDVRGEWGKGEEGGGRERGGRGGERERRGGEGREASVGVPEAVEVLCVCICA